LKRCSSIQGHKGRTKGNPQGFVLTSILDHIPLKRKTVKATVTFLANTLAMVDNVWNWTPTKDIFILAVHWGCPIHTHHKWHVWYELTFSSTGWDTTTPDNMIASFYTVGEPGGGTTTTDYYKVFPVGRGVKVGAGSKIYVHVGYKNEDAVDLGINAERDIICIIYYYELS